jgi:Group II intron, maturase-specific domain
VGIDFLGFHHRLVRAERGYRHMTFLARWPSREAMQPARTRIREITDSKRPRDPVEVIVKELNRFLRGWGELLPLLGLREACSSKSGSASTEIAVHLVAQHATGVTCGTWCRSSALR